MTKLLCVYCSSSLNLAPDYYEMAETVGQELVKRGWGLVYGGGKTGLMGSVARGVKASGGVVVGVIPEFMKDRELAYEEADELITVETMAERKQVMIARAAAFLALPGGIGTLEEISEVLTLRYLSQLHLPAVILNYKGYFQDLLKFFDHMQREKFRKGGMPGLYAVADSIDDVWAHLDDPKHYEADKLWQAKK